MGREVGPYFDGRYYIYIYIIMLVQSYVHIIHPYKVMSSIV